MKTVNIMAELLKLVDKGKTIKVLYGYDEEKNTLYITMDEYVAYAVPTDKWYVNLEKAIPNKRPIGLLEKMSSGRHTADNCRMTEERIQIRSKIIGDETCVIFENHGEKAYVQEKLLKNFDLKNKKCSHTYKMTDSNSPVFIYEAGTFVGFVLPVYFKEKGNGEDYGK